VEEVKGTRLEGKAGMAATLFVIFAGLVVIVLITKRVVKGRRGHRAVERSYVMKPLP